MLEHCVNADINEAYKVPLNICPKKYSGLVKKWQTLGKKWCVFLQIIEQLWSLGYSPEDIIGNIFRVCKTFQMAEYLKLEYIKVCIALVVSP